MKEINEKTKGFSSEFIAINKKILLHNILEMDDLLIVKREIMRIIVAIKTDVSIEEITTKIQFDNFYSNEVFRLINFELFINDKPEAKNLFDALTKIDEEKLENIIYAASLKYILKNYEMYFFDSSYSTSLLIDEIIRKYNFKTKINLPVTMLLSNLGSVILKRDNQKKYTQLHNISKNENIPIQRCESSILHLNHTEIAKILLGKWNISRDIIYLISNHHIEDLKSEKYNDEIELIQFVNWIDNSIRVIPCFKPKKSPFNAHIAEIKKIARTFIESENISHNSQIVEEDIKYEKTQLMNRDIIKKTKKGEDTQVLYLNQLNLNFKSAKKEIKNNINKIETKEKTQLIDRTIVKEKNEKELIEKVDNLKKTQLIKNVLLDEIKSGTFLK